MPLALRVLISSLVLVVGTSSPLLAQGRATLNGVVIGPGGAPQPNVTLIVTNAQGIDRRGVTDGSGAFVFGGLQPGTYRLRTDDETFAPFSQDQIALTGGQTMALKIQLQPRVPVTAAPTQRATLQGTVINPVGAPAGNIVIFITNAEGIDRRVVSDLSGAYIFGGLQPGTYRLRIEDSGPGARPFPTTEIIMAPGERRQLDIRLQPVPPPPPPPIAAPAAAKPAAPPPTPKAAKETKEPKNKDKDAVPQVAAVTATGGEFEAMPNRWDFKYPVYQRYTDEKKMPWVVGGPMDPYNQNAAKGDFPIAGNSLFANVNLQVNSTFNPRQIVAGEPTDQFFYNNNFVAGAEIFRGDTVFQPKSWAVRGTVVGNINGVTSDFRKQTYGVEEAFAEKRLAVLGPTFDFVSVRGGMQNFNADFRGYVFVDNQLGARLFGNAGSNRGQYNVAYFSMRDRDTASQLHKFSSRDQQVFVANYYLQDFGGHGYTAMFNVLVNHDAKTSVKVDGKPESFDQTGALQVVYAGFHGDGKWGAWSVSHAFYQVFGKDDDNKTARKLNGGAQPAPVDVNARMAAIELSRDSNWYRYRLSAYYASGDDRSDPGKAKGFDMITDNPNLAGGQFMFWTQQKTDVNMAGAPQAISDKFSLLPNLRSKFTDRSNFANPGLVLLNGGVDMRLSPSLKVVTNVSYLKFADATVLRDLEALKAQPKPNEPQPFADESIGWDVSVGAKFRPFVNENLFIVTGFSKLIPKGGFATALGSNPGLYSFVGAIQVAY